MIDVHTPNALGDNMVTGVAEDLDHPSRRPGMPLRTPEQIHADEQAILREEEERHHANQALAERQEREVELQRLEIEVLVTKAWHARLRQMRGAGMEFGTRDMHVKNEVLKALMTIAADNADL